jgi:hypothetical protein
MLASGEEELRRLPNMRCPSRLVKTFTVGVALALGACSTAEDQVASVGPRTPRPVAPSSIQGPYVQAGTIFSMKLDEPIDTFYTPPGTHFTGTVVTPLVGPDGRVLVPYGAKVRGTLASVGDPEIPRLRVDLQNIDTVDGTVPLHASVRHAQHYDWVGPPTPEPYASYIFPYDFLEYGSDTSAPGTSPPMHENYGATMMQPREVRVPAGALVQVQLVDPLMLPGARLVH